MSRLRSPLAALAFFGGALALCLAALLDVTPLGGYGSLALAVALTAWGWRVALRAVPPAVPRGDLS